MKILTAAEMRETDRRTIEAGGLTFLQLATHAGEAVARFVAAEFPDARKIVVLCGKGNNGGDGMMAAAALADAGRKPQVLLLGRRDELDGDPLIMFRKSQPRVPLTELAAEADLHEAAVANLFAEADLIVDAIVGTGFKPPLRGVAATLRGLIEPMPTPVVAIDIPSGWDAASMQYAAASALRAVYGVGEAKLERYGEAFLAVVRGHLAGDAA